jgi:cytochrome c biogenesis protein CcmG/thiol:disulfide interchange protein DsbE
MDEITTPSQPSGPPKTAFLALGVVVVFLGCVGLGLFNRNTTQPVSGPAPDFSVPLFDGYDGGLDTSTLTLSDLRGRVVLINFFASWCIPCEQEAPELEATWRAYRDRGVLFLGIAWADNDADAINYLKRFNITFANGPDRGTKIGPRYHITGVPETFIVDQNGDVAFFKPSPITQAELATALDKLLAGQ